MRRGHLTLIRGGETFEMEGPMSRLGWDAEASAVSQRQIYFLIASKLVLLGSALYLFYS